MSDDLRLGLVHLVAPNSSNVKSCKLCGGHVHGLVHVLAECSAVAAARHVFLEAGGALWKHVLANALEGDWPAAVLSPHSGIQMLRAAVRFTSTLARKCGGRQ